MSTATLGRMPDLCSRRQPLHYATALNLLMTAGVDLHEVNLLPAGEHQNYRGEILEQQPAAGTVLGPGVRITLRVGFPSAADILPYQFFYGLAGRREVGSAWEDRARGLMAMFDSTEIRYHGLALRQVLKFHFSVPDDEQLARFLGLFAFSRDKLEDRKETLLWAALLPSFHEWSGNPDRVAGILQKVFGYHFRIVENDHSEFEIPQDIRYRLGSRTGRLGRESIVGRTFAEYDSAYEVIVSGIPIEEITAFLPGGALRKKVEQMLRFCMPSGLDFRVVYETDAGTLTLGNMSRLGYSTRL